MVASLVENGQRQLGRFTTTPWANPFDEFHGVKKVFERFRTKEWAGFTLLHPEMAGSMIIQDAKYLVTGELYVYDRAEDTMVEWAANRLRPSRRMPADLLHSRCVFISGGFRLGYGFSDHEVLILIDVDATPSRPAVNGRLTLDVAGATPPLVVSSLMPGGAIYTNKLVYPASGYILCGDKRYEFDPKRDCAILDEHKSHLPYHTDWDWSTFAWQVDGHIIGANLISRPSLPGQEEESCIWTPTQAQPLSDITFTQTGDDLSPWSMVSADGRVNVVFNPQGHKDHNLNAGLVAMEYAQWFGHYNGTISDGVTVWPVENVPGVCERMHARL